jgi:hypothetical protein
LGKRPGRHCKLREETVWPAWVKKGGSGGGAWIYCCERIREETERWRDETE